MRIKSFLITWISLFLISCSQKIQNPDPSSCEIITSDLNNFWKAFDEAKPDFSPDLFESLYLKPGTKGLKGFMNNRIVSAEHFAKTVKSHSNYYKSIRNSTESISRMENEIRASLRKLKDLYPESVFPPIFFVIGALNSGGTTSGRGLIIGAEMYGLTPDTPTEELDEWLLTVLKPVEEIPHIVAHELVHYQQNFRTSNLLGNSIKEGSADFISELTSGQHINGHIHEFANPIEHELWEEFKERMYKNDNTGWLYSSSEGRPNDLGYWMGYRITKAFYDRATDKKKAIWDILNIKDFKGFLEESGYNGG